MPNVGSAYVTLMPSMKGFAAGVNKGISGIDTSSSGKAIGAKAAKGFAGGFASGGIVIGAAAAVANKAMEAVCGSMSRAISRVDTMRNFPKVMVNLGYSAEDAARNIQAMSDGLDGLPTSLDAMVSMVQQLTPLSSSMDEATQIGLAFNNMLLAGGADMQQQQSALLQYTQALAKGKPELQDWRTLQQVMPGQLDQTAKALLGASAKSMDLYDALKSGKVSMSDFNQAILRLNTEGANGFASFEQQARDATTGIQTAMDNMATRTAKGVATMIDAIGQENISGAINYLSSGIGGIANDLAGDLSVATGFLVDHREQIAGLVDDMTALVPAATRAYGAVLLFKGARGIFNGVSGGIGNLTGKVNDLGERVFMQGVKMEQGGKLAQKGARGFQSVGNALAGATTPAVAGALAVAAGGAIVIGTLASEVSKASSRQDDFRKSTDEARSAVFDITGIIDKETESVRTLSDFLSIGDSMDGFFASQKEHAETIINTRDKLNEQVTSLDSAYAAIEKYAGQSDLTTQEQGKLRAAIDTVNSSCGTQYKVVDAANGAISDSKGNYDEAKAAAGEYKNEIYKVIEAKKQEARVEAAKDSLVEAYKQQDEAASEYTKKYGEYMAKKAEYDAAMATVGPQSSPEYVAMVNGIGDELTILGNQLGIVGDAANAADTKVKNLETGLGLAAQGVNGASAAFSSFASNTQFDAMLDGIGKDVNDFSRRMEEVGVSVDTLATLSREQLAQLAYGFNGSGESIVKTLADMGVSIDGFNAKELKDKRASVQCDDSQLVDAQGSVYTWNGTDLIDQNGTVAVDGTQLVDAYGNIITWNKTNFLNKKASVSVDKGPIQQLIDIWESWNPTPKVTTTTEVRYADASGRGNRVEHATGGFVRTHASGGFLTSGVTGLGMDRDGNYHVAGEDGIEWIKYHADGTTSIVPIENRKYLEPYASVIASMIPNRGGTTVNETNIHMDYRAGEDAKTIIRDMARRIRRQSLMRG